MSISILRTENEILNDDWICHEKRRENFKNWIFFFDYRYGGKVKLPIPLIDFFMAIHDLIDFVIYPGARYTRWEDKDSVLKTSFEDKKLGKKRRLINIFRVLTFYTLDIFIYGPTITIRDNAYSFTLKRVSWNDFFLHVFKQIKRNFQSCPHRILLNVKNAIKILIKNKVNDDGILLTPENEKIFQYYQKNYPGMFKDKAHFLTSLSPTKGG